MLDLDKTMDMLLDWVGEIGENLVTAVKTKDYQLNFKSSGIDYVTQHDLNTEKALKQKIMHFFPEHGIFSEETESERLGAEYIWVIDPIDGTTNFAHGFPYFAISVALKYKDEVVLAVVHAPMLQQTFKAIIGQGAYLSDFSGEHKLVVSQIEDLEKSVVTTGFPYCKQTNNMNLPYFSKIVSRVSGIRRCGAASVDLSMVGAGAFDAYWEFCLSEWDYAAASLIITEAGGVFEKLEHEGNDLIIAGNPTMFAILKAILLEDK